MGTFILLLAIVIAIFVLMAYLKAKGQRGRGDEGWPVYARKPMSRPEQVLYFRLVEALPEHIVLAQVQLSRIVGVRKCKNRQAWFNRINRMSVDFVVCNKDSSIVAVIELDDATHQRESRQRADAKKEKALASADIRLVRWQVQAMPDVAVIQATLLSRAAGAPQAPALAQLLAEDDLPLSTA